MSATTPIRDLRNPFSKVRKGVEAQGERTVAENGRPRYQGMRHTETPAGPASSVDYRARLAAQQPVALTSAQARALREDNRGDR